jgi:hypothetical protein
MIRLPVLASLLLLSSGQVRAQDQDAPVPMAVTSDTGAYCQILLAQIRAHGALPPAVRDLQAEGRDLCNEGQIRGGINRLRRALMVLHSSQEASALGRTDAPRD